MAPLSFASSIRSWTGVSAMQMYARIESDDSEQLTSLAVAYTKTYGASGIPIRRTRLGIALARIRSVVERDPR